MTSRPKPHQVEDLARKQELALRQRQALVREVQDVRTQLGTEPGRRVAFQWLERAGLIFGELVTSEGLLNPTVVNMSAAVAQRTVAWRFDFVARLTCNDLWIRMLEENAPDQFQTILTIVR